MKLFKAFKKGPVKLHRKIEQLEARIKELEDELALEKTWQEGEIDFLQDIIRSYECRPQWNRKDK